MITLVSRPTVLLRIPANRTLLIGVGCPVSGILCCKFVGASLFMGYSFRDDLNKKEIHCLKSQTFMLFDRNFEGKHDASFSVPHYSIAK